jgi:hypothetical protein
MGDSFAFGHGVQAGERFSSVFANALALRVDPKHVVSLAYKNGFQPEHYEYYLKMNPDIRPKYLVISLYLGNDLESDVRETRFNRADLALELPYRSVEQGALVTRTPYRIAFLRELVRSSNFARLTAILVNRSLYRSYLFEPQAIVPNTANSVSTEYGEPSEYSGRAWRSIVEIHELAQSWGGKVLLLIIPQNFYSGAVSNPHIRPDLAAKIPEIVAQGGIRAAALRRCEALKLECLDAGLVLEAGDFLAGDPHWNPQGHRKVGLLLAKHFLENGRSDGLHPRRSAERQH